MLSISIRPPRFSHDLIKESGEFVVNIPTSDMIDKVDGCGTVSGDDVDKFAKFGLTAAKASKVSAPMIEECPVNIECVTKQIIKLGAHDMFIAEIVAVNVSEKVLTDGKIDFDKFESFAYLNGEYRTIADKIGSYGFTAKK
jgi:flavin reductase (DIM6/NTAB) family NADH-FMN oxidoreductase RutF